MRRHCAKQKQSVGMLENETEFGGGAVRNTVGSGVVAVAAVEEDVEKYTEEDVEKEEGEDLTEGDRLAKELGRE